MSLTRKQIKRYERRTNEHMKRHMEDRQLIFDGVSLGLFIALKEIELHAELSPEIKESILNKIPTEVVALAEKYSTEFKDDIERRHSNHTGHTGHTGHSNHKENKRI